MEPKKEDVLSALRQAGSKGLKTKDIAGKLGVGSRDLGTLRSLLRSLESEGSIFLGRRRRYQLPGEAGYIKGRVHGYGRKVAMLVSVDGQASLRVDAESLGGARHGDLVLARISRGSAGEREARVVKVLEKAPAEVLGQIAGRDAGGIVHVDSEHRHKSVSVDGDAAGRPGDYVVVRVGRWGEPYESARGRITEVLGGRFTPGEQFAHIAREFNLPLAFPEAVLKEAGAITARIPEREVKRRADLTGLLTFTVDPEDAKDFDDAISVEEVGKGSLRIGVHIADVSHYVKEGSALDHEALARGRSIYLVDRVIPMLPAELSGDLAALREGELRLAVSVIMDLDERGDVGHYEIKKSVIRSRARLTYEEAQRLIDKGAGWRAPRDRKQIAEALKRANQLRRTLRDRRLRRGAIEMETPDVDIILDGSGNTVGVKPARRLEAHNLIEELMILANETVAGYMSYLGRHFLYRVHEVPSEEDMKDLSVFAATFGYRFRWARGMSPKALQTLLDKVRGRPEEYIVSVFLLRSLKKAVYSERNLGHFGLASKCYTHFTSPIRRYPDLLVHRLLKTYGLHRSQPADKDALLRLVRSAAEIGSTREVEGDEAERAAIKARIAEFMEQKVGEEYWGVVSGIKDFGFFVMLEENLIEGLVHVASLGDDYYTTDSTGTMLIGVRGGRYYRIGDRVLVKVHSVDRERREVDFRVVIKQQAEGQVEVRPEPVGRSRRRTAYRRLEGEARKARSAGRRRGGGIVRGRREARRERSLPRPRRRRPDGRSRPAGGTSEHTGGHRSREGADRAGSGGGEAREGRRSSKPKGRRRRR